MNHSADMSVPSSNPSRPKDLHSEAITRACERIAPTWPLDRFIAVNPLWHLIDRPFAAVAAELTSHTGSRWLMPRSWYRQAFEQGRLRDEHLAAAIAESGAPVTVDQLRTLMTRDDTPSPRRARVADVIDAQRDLVHEMSWRDFVTHSVSQLCASYFDEAQAAHQPHRAQGLFAHFRQVAQADRAPSLLMGLHNFRAHARRLPPTALEMLSLGLRDLGVSASDTEAYLWSLLLDQNGWASWCAYRRWSARLSGGDDDSIVELLAIRMAWEWLLHGLGGVGAQRRWRAAMERWGDADEAAVAAQRNDWLLQRAMEHAWQQSVLNALPKGFDAERPRGAQVQAVFCIDVRSEVFRRALEASSGAVQTLGFAGFFGMPIAYQSSGTAEVRPQLPGLLAPRLLVSDEGVEPREVAARARRLELAKRWKTFKTGALSAFTFVEALGPLYAVKLLADSVGAAASDADVTPGLARAVAQRSKPRLVGTLDGNALSMEARCSLAENMLRAMSLTRDFARIVLLAGHGGATRNNAHAAGLDCGACCGQTGEVNARAAAALLNATDVRSGLAARGIDVPSSTWFVAALHNTTTDDLVLFDEDEIPVSHAPDVHQLRVWLNEAGRRARAERAGALKLEAGCPDALHRAMQQRTRDWAQVRAEWGLANNAALIVAPRERCRHLNLGGRSFLHEYRATEDPSFATLELIMTAPMVVTHWINFQYYASTVDPLRYGSGNKVLHNVVGGHIGVFEGNGGDLRIGLPWQSVHDGESFMHTPLRLSVFIEAPRQAIEGVLHKHAHVRALVHNGWLSLFQVDADERCVHAYRDGRWVPTSEQLPAQVTPSAAGSVEV